MSITNGEIILRLLLATLIGLIYGVQRERSRKPAGSRTHILVCLAACLVSLLSAYGFTGAADNALAYRMDPARLVVGVLTGIGFIGAGIIWKTPAGSIHGVTTAAEIFLLAALGIGCGLGQYFLTLTAAGIGFLVLISAPLLDGKVAKIGHKKSAADVCAAEDKTP